MKKEWGAGRKGAIDFLELGDPLVPFQTIGDLKEGHGGSNLRLVGDVFIGGGLVVCIAKGVVVGHFYGEGKKRMRGKRHQIFFLFLSTHLEQGSQGGHDDMSLNVI